jgi:hypothetical protein
MKSLIKDLGWKSFEFLGIALLVIGAMLWFVLKDVAEAFMGMLEAIMDAEEKAEKARATAPRVAPRPREIVERVVYINTAALPAQQNWRENALLDAKIAESRAIAGYAYSAARDLQIGRIREDLHDHAVAHGYPNWAAYQASPDFSGW